MTKQELQQIIEDLNQLANSTENYVNVGDVLGTIHNDKFKRDMLDILASNNIPYTLMCISIAAECLAQRIYEFQDYEVSEKEYLHKVFRALNGFKFEIQRLQEYLGLMKQIAELTDNMAKYQKDLLDGVHWSDYKCLIDNIKL